MALSKETIADIKREYAELEARLDQLRGWQSWQGITGITTKRSPFMTRAEATAKWETEVIEPLARAAKRVRKAKPSPSRVLQGEYLKLIRQFSKRDRAKFGKLAKEKGRERAIREMKAALKAKGAKKKAPKAEVE